MGERGERVEWFRIERSDRKGGGELASRLEVDGLTVRRYVQSLQEMGIAVEGERGRYGAYSLKRGHKVRPLMFTDEEGLSQRGIADRLGLSETTVNGILKRREVSAVAARRGTR